MSAHRLLVVDDEATIRNFLVRVLEREGYQVQAAQNGREALHDLEVAPFDLLLTDIKMDRLDGVELLKEARRRFPDLAIILLTGHATVDSAITALRQGAQNYLLKPVRNEDVVAAVAAALEQRAHQQRRDKLEQIAAQLLDVIELGEGIDGPSPGETSRISYSGLGMDSVAYVATLHGEPLGLTPTEFRLLIYLGSMPGVSVDYITLVQVACGYTCTRQEAQEIIGTHIRNLRQKLGVDPDHPLYIESVRGIGYRLIPGPTGNQ
jgi:DNA-binding response OmpR family regulator